MGHFQNKEGTNAGGGLLPLCFIFYFLHSSKLLHMETWKSHKGRRLRRPQMHGEYLLCCTVRTWPQAEGNRRSSLEPMRGIKHIYKCVCTNIDCRRLGVGMLDHVGKSYLAGNLIKVPMFANLKFKKEDCLALKGVFKLFFGRNVYFPL